MRCKIRCFSAGKLPPGLHAVERLFDILASTLPAGTRDGIDFRALKKAAFEYVIEEESGRLTLIPELLAQLRDAVAAL